MICDCSALSGDKAFYVPLVNPYKEALPNQFLFFHQLFCIETGCMKKKVYFCIFKTEGL